MLDASQVEVVKENVQPRKRGRDAQSLKQVLEMDGHSLKKERQRRIEQFEERIRCYSGPDPLELRIEYIKWAFNCTTSADLKFEIDLLEKCAREFVDSDVYKNDNRYLTVWLDYADLVDDPLDIFSFLESKSIGAGLSARYVAHARVLEAKGRLNDVELLLQKAIQREAEPLAELQNFQRAFQQRSLEVIAKKMLEEQQKSSSQRAAPPDQPQQPAHRLRQLGSRQTLGALSRRDVRHNARMAPLGAPAVGGPAPAPHEQFASNVPGTPFAIFDEHAEGDALGGGGGASQPWSSLPSHMEGKKENRRQAEPWVNQSLPQAKDFREPSVCGFAIYEDGAPEPDASQLATPTVPNSRPSLRLALRDEDEQPEQLVTTLQFNPLLRFSSMLSEAQGEARQDENQPSPGKQNAPREEQSAGEEQKRSSQEKADKRDKEKKEKKEKPDKKDKEKKEKKEARYAFSLEALGSGDNELSFEELWMAQRGIQVAVHQA